jgi:uncharacterized membrane protein
MNQPSQPSNVPAPLDGFITLTHVIYGLHALTVLTGLVTTAFIVTAFVTGWPSIIAVILNYMKRSEVRGTFLESHFRWQIRTFWFALLWIVVAMMIGLTFFGLPIALVIAGVAGLWVLYRIIRGWTNLVSRQPMPI